MQLRYLRFPFESDLDPQQLVIISRVKPSNQYGMIKLYQYNGLLQ